MKTALRAINRFGSKSASAYRYPEPRHDLIIEPFAGGAGYALLHHRKRVLLLDVDPDVINVWKYLIGATTEEIMGLPLILPEQDVADLKCSEGGRLLISWCLNQTATPRKKLSSWGVFHGDRACYWGARRRKQSAVIAARVKHWRAELADYRTAPDAEATWFIDPPYMDGGSHYRHSHVDYSELSAWCRSRRGQPIVCERAGATWLPFSPLYSAPTMRRFSSSRRRCAESVWLGDGVGPAQSRLFPESA